MMVVFEYLVSFIVYHESCILHQVFQGLLTRVVEFIELPSTQCVTKGGSMKNCGVVASVVVGIVLITGCPLWAQITLEWDEIPHAIGTRWSMNFAYEVSVDLGAVGGPQTWTFTSQPMGQDSYPVMVIPVSQAPYCDSFPDANLVYSSMLDNDSGFLYMQLDTNLLSLLGLSGTASSGICGRLDPADTNDLPDHYNDSRNYNSSYTYDLGSGSSAVFRKKGFEHINAYGTVVIPYGSFPCLRYVLYDTLIQTIYYFGIPVYSDTSATIQHQFVAEGRSFVVGVTSEDGETNPYFTFAAELQRLTYFVTGIDEAANLMAQENTVQVQPNPFTGTVTFKYTGYDGLPGNIDIYDVQGRRVQSLAAGGAAAVTWSGNNVEGKSVPDGVYFFVLRAGNREFTGKVVKTR